MSIKISQEKTMKCPFDPSHVMPYERFLNHLDKCKFEDKKSYRKCKFNPYHVFHMEKISGHQQKCPDRIKYGKEEDDWGVQQQQPVECSKTIASNSTSYSQSPNNYSNKSIQSYGKNNQKQQKKQISKKSEKSAQNSILSVQDF